MRQQNGQLAEYIKNFYGTCSMKEKCTCLKIGPWLGSGCINWNPVKVSSYDELIDIKNLENK